MAKKELKEQLEKENAELKKKIGIYQKGMYDEIEKRDKKLTKAKEIISDLINLTKPTSTEETQHWNETFRKAEAFLKE